LGFELFILGGKPHRRLDEINEQERVKQAKPFRAKPKKVSATYLPAGTDAKQLLFLAMPNLGSHASLLPTEFPPTFSCFLRSHRQSPKVKKLNSTAVCQDFRWMPRFSPDGRRVANCSNRR
jgi:hypothetical protein